MLKSFDSLTEVYAESQQTLAREEEPAGAGRARTSDTWTAKELTVTTGRAFPGSHEDSSTTESTAPCFPGPCILLVAPPKTLTNFAPLLGFWVLEVLPLVQFSSLSALTLLVISVSHVALNIFFMLTTPKFISTAKSSPS